MVLAVFRVGDGKELFLGFPGYAGFLVEYRGIDYWHVHLDPFLIISEYSLIKIDMITLRNNERLMAEIDRIAEVAGYLWIKGWAERNGGNISVNLTTLLSEEEKALPALVSSIPLQEAMTALCGHVF